MEKNWIPIEFDYKDLLKNKDKISNVVEGTKPVLIIRNFYDSNLCKIVVKNTKEYSNFKNKIFKKIGTSLLSFLTQKSDYFSQAEASREIFHRIFEGIEDPRKKIHHILSEFYPQKKVEVAKEGIKKYACEGDDGEPDRVACVQRVTAARHRQGVAPATRACSTRRSTRR